MQDWKKTLVRDHRPEVNKEGKCGMEIWHDCMKREENKVNITQKQGITVRPATTIRYLTKWCKELVGMLILNTPADYR